MQAAERRNRYRIVKKNDSAECISEGSFPAMEKRKAEPGIANQVEAGSVTGWGGNRYESWARPDVDDRRSVRS